MTDPHYPRAPITGADSSDETRHQQLATLLGAFADGELPPETASEIDAHLLGCQRCRRELSVHTTLRIRLEQEPLVPASGTLRERIVTTVGGTPAPHRALADAPHHGAVTMALPGRRRLLRRVMYTVGALAVVIAVIEGARWVTRPDAPAGVSVVAASSVPLFSAALADYRRVMAEDLPGRDRDLATVRAAVSFPVQPMENSSLRLLAAWTTNLDGEVVAVLAYRWDDRVLLQYVVSELQLYRRAEVRNAFAAGSALGVHDKEQSLLAWPTATAGSLLIADVSLDRLAELRATTPRK